MLSWMKASPPLSRQTEGKPFQTRGTHSCRNGHDHSSEPVEVFRQEVRVICLYPTVAAGKLARTWLESAIRQSSPGTYPTIEFFNYAVLDHGGISWSHVMGRICPDVILMLGDGHQTLGSGLRHSLRELISQGSTRTSPLVIFRNLEAEPSLNSRILLDYVSALTHTHRCELRAMNGNGSPIGSYMNPIRLLASRRLHE